MSHTARFTQNHSAVYILHDNTLYKQISHTITKTGNDIQKLYLRLVSLPHISTIGVFEHEWDIDEVHNQLKRPQVVDFLSTEEVDIFPRGGRVVESCHYPL